MSAKAVSLLAALVALAAVGAQIAFPGAAIFHTWQYALALAVLAYLLITYAAPALRGKEGRSGRFIGVALAGALIVVAGGMSSGLLGPDTDFVTRAPGSIAPLPEVGAAAFFSNVDPNAIRDGSGIVTLRRRNHSDVVVTPGSHKFLGASLLMLTPLRAAYIDAADERGNHLTVTQQTSGAFLSPVLLFHDEQSIAGEMHPVSSFELPGAKRSVKVVYFGAGDVVRMHFHVPPSAIGQPVLLYDVFNADTNNSVGIDVGASGAETRVGGVRLRATLGTYPELVIASVPPPIVLIVGLGLFVVGLALAALQPDRRAVREAVGHEEQHRNREQRVRS